MKTNLRSKLRTLAFLGIAIIAAASTQPLFAVPLDLQITENSSTSLSATLDGSAVTVQNTAPGPVDLNLCGYIRFRGLRPSLG